MRAIDGDALNEDLRDSYNKLRKIYERLTYAEDRAMCEVELSTLLEVLMRIKKAPTLDVAPVVHGWWIDGVYKNRCNLCGNFTERKASYPRYCSGCGAKMDGDAR